MLYIEWEIRFSTKLNPMCEFDCKVFETEGGFYVRMDRQECLPCKK